MKIAVWLDRDYSPKSGGSFSYTDRLIKAIDDYNFTNGLDICFVSFEDIKSSSLKKEVIRLNAPLYCVASKMNFLPARVLNAIKKLYAKVFNKSILRQLEDNQIKIVYYISQFGTFIKDFPFVVSHWDIAHRSTYAFPEFSVALQNSRDKYYKSIVPRALMLFVESDTGKKELLRYSFINEQRIKFVPLFAGECASFDVPVEKQQTILSNYNLVAGKYFFYPAQFLAEKNHAAVVLALSEIKKDYPDYKVVFTGASEKSLCGTLDYIKDLSIMSGLSDSIVFPGFVPLEDMYVFYKNACAHIMASYVGPTNMPPLEAMEIGCPVICSDLGGHREELGDAAIYFNPMDIDQLANAMKEMINNGAEWRERIIKQSKVCIYNVNNAMRCIDNALYEASIVRSTWK